MEHRHSGRSNLVMMSVSLVLMLALLLPGGSYAQFQPGQKRMIPADEKTKLKGVILTRDGEMFILRDIARNDTTVVLTDTTKVRTERKGLFRGLKPFDVSVLVPGLIIEAWGTGDSQGRLMASDIRFSESDLKAALTAYAQSAPINKGLSETDQKLAQTSQEVVDTNKRINELDNYDLVKTVTVLFAVNSAKLSKEAQAQLDELASKAPEAKNYMVEVQGYADPTGDFQKNLELSQRRAQTVVQYLAVKHNIPLRRIMTPMGYGETKPVGEQKTAEGRAQSRRVEVKVLVNKGLASGQQGQK